jgi:hypothetical protein
MGIQAETAALESTSAPRGREVAIFAVIWAGLPVGLFSDEISDELQTQKIVLYYILMFLMFHILDRL